MSVITSRSRLPWLRRHCALMKRRVDVDAEHALDLLADAVGKLAADPCAARFDQRADLADELRPGGAQLLHGLDLRLHGLHVGRRALRPSCRARGLCGPPNGKGICATAGPERPATTMSIAIDGRNFIAMSPPAATCGRSRHDRCVEIWAGTLPEHYGITVARGRSAARTASALIPDMFIRLIDASANRRSTRMTARLQEPRRAHWPDSCG